MPTMSAQRVHTAFLLLGVVITQLLALPCVNAQELAPRVYWPAPTGTNAVVLGYQFSTGDIITDPTLPVTGVQSDINYTILTYQRYGSLFGRTANVQVNLPYSWGNTEGYLDDEYVNRSLDGSGDLRISATINLRGAPAMDPADMQELRANPRTIVGFSLTALVPTGSYNPDRLLNVGSNRWSIKPAFGMIWPIRPTWLLEMEVGAWVFGDNHDFQGLTREQDPIWSAEIHLVKRIRPGFWASLDLNRYRGGETRLDNGPPTSFQRNARAGATLVFPFAGGRALRFSYSRGVTTRIGGDYDLYTLHYAVAWR